MRRTFFSALSLVLSHFLEILSDQTNIVMSQESLSPPPLYENQRSCSNVLVVGETGTGKSSVINLIAGEQLAIVSSRADGCTLNAEPYDMVLRDSQDDVGYHVRLFDTVGLNEPELSKNDYLTAIQKANELIGQLQGTGGIRLLIFCIRGGRITSTTEKNYLLFRDVLCQNKVPVAFVITGMENQVPMEGWWQRNAERFKQSKLFCSSHVCVTATRGLNNAYANQYNESQEAIRKMLLNHLSTGASWQPSGRKSWFVHLASRLLTWVTNIKDRRRALVGRPRPMSKAELVRYLEDRCGFTPEEAKDLGGKILAQRMENVTPRTKEENAGYLSGTY